MGKSCRDSLTVMIVVNTVTNRVVRLLGKDETVRWMNLSLYQGAPAMRGRLTVVSIKNFCIDLR